LKKYAEMLYSIDMEDNQRGKEHPLSVIINKAVKIFTDLGFQVATGPELRRC
jgi:phenylalanyl-tRNA synthetase alpha subunit